MEANLIIGWSESIMQFIPSFYESHLGSNVKDILESNYVGYYNELMVLFFFFPCY